MTDPPEGFNLVDSGWILALRHDGATEDLSIRDAFGRADEFVQILGEVSTQAFAIQRLLLAILHRAIGGPEDVAHWRAIRDSWGETLALVDEYLATFRDRFDLFHPVAPFFQVADLRTAKGEVSGLEKLIADVPNGAPFFTMRLNEGLERIPPAESARWLVHVQAFDPSGIRSGAVGDPRVTGGKGYPIGPAWAGQLGGVAMTGGTVRKTLLLNLVAPTKVGLATGPSDLPPWEREQLTERADEGREPRGLVDLYTWQARRVRLVRDSGGVTGLVLAQGDRIIPQNRQVVEPMTAWRYSEPQTKKLKHDTYMPRRHDPERVFWRGLAGLLPEVRTETSGRAPAASLQPAVLTWVDHLRAAGVFSGSDEVRVRATGVKYGSNESTIDELVDDVLAFPAELLRQEAEALRLTAVDAVERSEEAARALANLAGNLAAAAGAGDIDGPRDRVREHLYAALDVPFRDWLRSLTPSEAAPTATSRWQREVRSIALEISDELVRGCGPTAWIGRQVRGVHVDSGLAEAWFRKALSTALPRGRATEEEAKSA